MAGDLSLALRTAQSGLLVNQFALNTVANNVANVNTPDYSRRIVNQQQRTIGGSGAGVEIAALTREVDSLLTQGLRVEKARLAAMEAKDVTLQRLQSLFGSPGDNTSISHSVTEFAAAAESLALAPQGYQEQKALVLHGLNLADQLASMTETIQKLRQQADEDIAREVATLNGALEAVAGLNTEIAAARIITGDTVGLEDLRDAALDTVAELIDIRTFSRDNGSVMVFTTRGQILLDNVAAPVSHDPSGIVSASTSHATGAFNPITLGSGFSGRDLTTDLPDGKLASLVELRDSLLPALQSSIDELTATLIDSVNAIHNRGVAFPGLATMTGSRVFVDTSATTSHEISVPAMPPGSDTVIAVLDSDGNQLAATSLRTVMTAATGLADGPWSVSAIASALDGWLQGATAATTGAAVGFDAEGHLTINLNTTTAFLALRDVDGSGAAADLEIRYDSDGDGNTDETVSGFSSFFGLNDFFTDGRSAASWQSAVIETEFALAANTVLTIQSAAGVDTVSLSAGDDLETIARRLTEAGIGISAAVVPEGDGYRLRLKADALGAIAVTDGGANLIAGIGLRISDVGVASSLGVRADIVALPGRIATGALQFDATRGAAGEYLASVGGDTTARNLAAGLSEAQAFDTAGTIKGTRITLVDYASAVVGSLAIETSTLSRNLAFQRSLTSAIEAEANAISGVNLDEEMSNLILFEQAYNAAARIITVIREMFETLQNAVS